jgi:hypothetical protein
MGVKCDHSYYRQKKTSARANIWTKRIEVTEAWRQFYNKEL